MTGSPARCATRWRTCSASASTGWRWAMKTPTTRHGAPTLLKRIIGRLQDRFPNTRILVRLDAGFAEPELFEFLDIVGVDYVVAMAKNKVLERQAELDLI